MYTWGAKNLKNKKTFISKRLLKMRFNFDPSKVYDYHLVKVSQKKITLSFIFKLFNQCFVTINNLEWNSI
jgi:hypothetical protein